MQDGVTLELIGGRPTGTSRREGGHFDGPTLGPLHGVILNHGWLAVYASADQLIEMPQFRRRFYYGGNSYGALRISATDAEPPADQFREHLARIRHAPARNRGARPVSIHPHLWTRFHEQLGVFLDGVRELAGDPAADSVASALDGVLVRSRDGRTE